MKLVVALIHRFELWRAPEWLASRLRNDFAGLEVVQLSSYEELGDAIADADILLAWTLRPQQFARARKLRWIHSTAAAVHGLMFRELVESDVEVTNASAVHAPVVAEHIVAAMLALAKQLPDCVRAQAERRWIQEKLRPRELLGARVCLVGLGAIGREFIARIRPFGVHITAVREHPERGPEGADAVAGPAELNRLLPECDYVVLAAPLTPATRGILSAERIALLRPSAYLINVGRGPLADEAALAEALRSRAIAGAALDVFSAEPLPPESPLWRLEDCLLTPHSAAITEKLWDRHYAFLSENLRRFISGESLLAVVDKRKGY